MFEIIKNKPLAKALAVLCAVLLVIIIFLIPLRAYIYNSGTYMNLYEKNDVFSEIDKDDAIKLTAGIISLLRYGSNIDEFRLKSSYSFFTSDEISHLYDVRILIQKFLITLYACIVLFLIFAFLIIQKSVLSYLKNISNIFIGSSCIVILLILLLYFFSSNFIFIFERFHHLFFPQGNWAFPEGSLLITLLPLNFFYDFFIKILVTAMIISVILLLTGIIFYIIYRIKSGRNERVSLK